MSPIRLLSLLLTAPLLICSELPPKVCGESFCFPQGTKLFSRKSPVEDFVLYRVEFQGERFVVYEGNAPQRRSGSFVIRWSENWPSYFEVAGPCASHAKCSAKRLAAEITQR